ncbi:hypothetical protein BDP27DRAFT_816497 [Rhodocollybia butyracea]|uniref:Uncharacterized protein n=1 Tax=Rhodocollybia butyracea TaxID=206335 RepID=A0A9P5PUV3_9AGAR|nr:hypothetical protein BDP27DRAFT_816497 [Rhodocollybia butyracea]
MIYYRKEFRSVFDLLETMHIHMKKVVDGTAFGSFAPWRSEDPLAAGKPDIAEHIKQLNIPCLYGDTKPLLLLHESGSFQSDPKLNERLEQIFSPTRNTFLVNSSGTGKTRLLYEGLCKSWGLFFTAAVDSYMLGSTDIDVLVQKLPFSRMFTFPLEDEADYEYKISTNGEIARREFGQTLLARLLVFKLFVDLMAKGEIEEVHKSRWFLAQIRPLVFGVNYESLAPELCRSLVSDALLADCISQCLEDIAAVFSRKPKDPHFFVVLDESTVMAESLADAFRDAHGPHPVLKEILETWDFHLRNKPVTIVAAGTHISRMYSREEKWNQWQWISSIGAFSTIEDQQQYDLKFLLRAWLILLLVSIFCIVCGYGFAGDIVSLRHSSPQSRMDSRFQIIF